MDSKGTFLPVPALRLAKKRHEKYQFVLGVRDREMMTIEGILKKKKIPYQYATHEGKLVTPRNCYHADPVVVADGHTVVLVECDPRKLIGFRGKPRIVDHHREHDPGFGLPPQEFWQASSLGQVWSLLNKGKEPLKFHLVTAARDHCRFAAAHGECPGVTAEEVSSWGRRWLAKELDIKLSHFEDSVYRWVETMEDLPVVKMGNQEVVDITRYPVGHLYSAGYMSIYEALAEVKCAALVRTGNEEGRHNKIVLMGDLVKSTVKHFKDVWGPARGLMDIYGCEVRGYAGGYLGKEFLMKEFLKRNGLGDFSVPLFLKHAA